MPDAPRVLTESGKIPDVTAEVKANTANQNVTEEEHRVVQADIQANKEDIETGRERNVSQDITNVAQEKTNVAQGKTDIEQNKTSEEIRQDLEDEMKRNRAAIAALQIQGDVLKGQYSLTQPLSPTTTEEENKTVELQRQEESRVGRARFIIALLIVGTSCALFGYQYVTGSNVPFPTALATALGAVVLYLFQKPSAVLGNVPTSSEPRSSGGPVLRGESYIVGEQGRERFTPSQSGHIQNAKDTANPPKPL